MGHLVRAALGRAIDVRSAPVGRGLVAGLMVFALFAPDGAGVDHLKALALVSRTMRNADIAAKLRANDDPDTLYTILIESQGTRAA